MIVVDSSVLISIMFRESDAAYWIETLSANTQLCMATATKLETISVVAGRGAHDPIEETHRLLGSFNIQVAPFDEAALDHALDGLIRYGKGRHAAKLNFGDCISYGLAKALNAPLLFKGDDFALTDVKAA
jgi:ribonuclease VapC